MMARLLLPFGISLIVSGVKCFSRRRVSDGIGVLFENALLVKIIAAPLSFEMHLIFQKIKTTPKKQVCRQLL
jgi:hypothetical protein